MKLLISWLALASVVSARAIPYTLTEAEAGSALKSIEKRLVEGLKVRA